MKSLKLTFICNSPRVPAGVEKTMLLLLEALPRHQIECSFILNGEGPFTEILRSKGAQIRVLPCSGRWSPSWHKQLLATLDKLSPDIVQLHLSRINAWALKRDRPSLPICERLNMTRHSSGFYPLQWAWLDRFTSRWIDAFIVVSASLKQDFLDRGYDPTKLSVIHNGVSVEQQTPADLRKELGLTANTVLIGTAGRLVPQKGIDTLLHAFSMLAPLRPELHLLIAGDGDQAAELRALSKTLPGFERVHFCGFRQDAPAFIGGLDIFVYLSRWEPFANTVLEAMAMGTPIVATSVGGNAEALGTDCGLQVPPNDPSAAVAAVGLLLDDQRLVVRLKDNARERIRLYSVENMVAAHARFYTINKKEPRESD